MIKTFTGIVEKKEYLTPSVLFLSLKIPEDFTFIAGQFVNIKMIHEGQSKMRSYSILNPPTQRGVLELCVKIVEGGFASVVFAQTKIGDVFEMKGPFGHFFLHSTLSDEHWFICAGTGVVPFYSMLKEHLAASSGMKFRLIFGTKTQPDLLFHREFLSWVEKYPHFTYVPTLSRENWEGKLGRVQEHLGEDLSHKTFYICGLKELVLETKEKLLLRGVSSMQIHFERYN